MQFFRYFSLIALFPLLSVWNDVNVYAETTDTICYVYVSLRGDDAVALYVRNPQNESLSKVYEEPVSGGPASLATDPSKRYLYVARRSASAISAYRIDPATGRLTFINEITAVDNPVYISTDKSGRFLLTAYYGAGKAAIYPLQPDGSIQGNATASGSTDLNPHSILTDLTGRFLYVTCMTGNTILQYAFDSVAGTFTALDTARVLPPEGTGPRHMAFHRTKSILYVVNETGNSVTAYWIQDVSGTLSAFQTISTLPDDYAGSSKCADIHLTPDSRFLYASNRGHESITAFAINSDDGSLTTIDQYPTVNTPREFDIDPSGTFLYAAGETSDNVAWYRIDKTTGALDSLGCIPTGKTPSWVMAVEFENSVTAADASPSPENHSGFRLINIPNPFSTITSINYFIHRPSRVMINIYDITGQLVTKLVDGQVTAGSHSVEWNSALTCSGHSIYYCRLESDFGCDTLKLVLVQ